MEFWDLLAIHACDAFLVMFSIGQVDLVKMVPVSSIVTQGFKSRLDCNTSRYVTSYQVLLGNNTRSLTPVMSSDGIPQVIL